MPICVLLFPKAEEMPDMLVRIMQVPTVQCPGGAMYAVKVRNMTAIGTYDKVVY